MRLTGLALLSPFIRTKKDEQLSRLVKEKASLLKGRFGGIVDTTAECLHKKIEQSVLTALFLMCHTLTDYRTIVDDFYKVVEFVEWLKEYYPEKIPLIIESK